MKKFIAGLGLFSFLMPALVRAEAIVIKQNGPSIQDFATGLLYNTALPILSVVALGALVWGGVNIIMAGGDESKVSKGRTILMYAVVGILLIICAYGIINLLGNAIYQNIN